MFCVYRFLIQCSESKVHLLFFRCVNSLRWNTNWLEGDESIILSRNIKLTTKLNLLSLCNTTLSVFEFSMRLNNYIYFFIKSNWLHFKVYISFFCIFLSINKISFGFYLVFAIPLIVSRWHYLFPLVHSLLGWIIWK